MLRSLSMLLICLTACDGSLPAEPVARDVELPMGRMHYDAALRDVDERLEAELERADQFPSSWMPLESAASASMARARLTGSLDDYDRAESLLELAYARTDNSGPHLTQAALDFSLHRFDRIEDSLAPVEARVLLDDVTASAIAGLRGDVHLQQGRYDAALEALQLAESLEPTSQSASRLAHYSWRTGDFETAEALYLEAADRYHGHGAEPRAWVHLQLGLMALDRRCYELALDHYLAANDELSGYYLIEEHVAEVFALTGRTEEALGLYLDITERTGNPEFMDAIAGLYLAADRRDLAEPWIERARAQYRAQLERYPEASYGHALQHFLDFGPPDEALDLAERNHELRPNGESARLLAEALLGAGRIEEARDVIGAALASTWSSPDLHWTAAKVHEASGRADLAERERAAAGAMEQGCQQAEI